MSNFIISAILISIFFLCYASFTSYVKQEKIISIIKYPSSILFAFSFLGCIAAYFTIPEQNDALHPSTIFTVLAIFCSTFLLTIIFSKIKSPLWQFIILIIFSSINIALLPHEFTFSNGIIPSLAEKLILITAWSLFAVFYNIMNASDGVISLQSLSGTIGLILMSIIGVLPALYGFYSGSLLACLLAYNFFNRYPSQIQLTNTETRILGFILGWLYILATIEGDGSCVIILNMYYFYELIIAILKKLSFKDQFKTLSNNTFYNNLTSSGIPPHRICELISRINLLLIFLAGFQIYAPNNYTIILISFFVVFWTTSQAISPSTDGSQHHILLTGSLLSFLKKKNKSTDEHKEP